MQNTIYVISNQESGKYIVKSSQYALTSTLEHAMMFKNKQKAKSFISKNFTYPVKQQLDIVDIYTGEVVFEGASLR